jgi:hypothetical protein
MIYIIDIELDEDLGVFVHLDVVVWRLLRKSCEPCFLVVCCLMQRVEPSGQLSVEIAWSDCIFHGIAGGDVLPLS